MKQTSLLECCWTQKDIKGGLNCTVRIKICRPRLSWLEPNNRQYILTAGLMNVSFNWVEGLASKSSTSYKRYGKQGIALLCSISSFIFGIVLRLQSRGKPWSCTKSLISHKALIVALHICNSLFCVPPIAQSIDQITHAPILVMCLLDEFGPEVWESHAQPIVKTDPTFWHRQAQAWHATHILCNSNDLSRNRLLSFWYAT